MKKVTAFIGTSAKRNTYLAVQEFEKNLKRHGDIDFEYVFLSNYHLEFCRSCLQCFLKGEENCHSKDDRNKLIEKLQNSDGVIFATPNYAFQVSARLKNFIDRLAFIYHRPRFFGKAFTGIVTQGVYGGTSILKYLNTTGESLGFHVSNGACVSTFDPMTRPQRKKLNQEMEKAAARFYRELVRPTPSPSFFRLFVFRSTRTFMKSVDRKLRDYKYYKAKGWFESDYFYPTKLGPIKKLAGSLFDFLGRQMAKHQ